MPLPSTQSEQNRVDNHYWVGELSLEVYLESRNWKETGEGEIGTRKGKALEKGQGNEETDWLYVKVNQNHEQ